MEEATFELRLEWGRDQPCLNLRGECSRQRKQQVQRPWGGDGAVQDTE